MVCAAWVWAWGVPWGVCRHGGCHGVCAAWVWARGVPWGVNDGGTRLRGVSRGIPQQSIVVWYIDRSVRGDPLAGGVPGPKGPLGEPGLMNQPGIDGGGTRLRGVGEPGLMN